MYLFGYHILLFRKLIDDVLKVVVKELKLPILLIMTGMQRET